MIETKTRHSIKKPNVVYVIIRRVYQISQTTTRSKNCSFVSGRQYFDFGYFSKKLGCGIGSY